jgi:hypothetical protein
MTQSNNPKMISKPEANPILALIMTLLLYNTGHVYNGQLTKWTVTNLLLFVGTILCVLPGLFILVLSIIDTFQTADRLSKGESIPENEYSMPLLFTIAKVIDQSATCSRS